MGFQDLIVAGGGKGSSGPAGQKKPKKIISIFGLGLVLFLVPISDCGFSGIAKDIGRQITQSQGKFVPNTFHFRYIDDLRSMEAINLNEALIPDQI